MASEPSVPPVRRALGAPARAVARPLALRAVVRPLALFACGAAAVAAWLGGLYACLALVMLLAAWLAALALLQALPPRAVPAAAPPGAVDGAGGAGGAGEAMLRAVLDQAPTPLLAIDRGGRVRALNRVARALFAADDRLVAPPPELAGGGGRLHHQGRAYRIDRIAAEGAGAARTIVALVDIESEERIAAARATRELLQVLSHEVMNALTPIASLSESARAALDDDPPPIARLRDMIGTVSRRAGGLLRFTEAYRRLARLPEPQRAPAALPALFDDLARMAAARWGDAVRLAIAPPPLVPVAIDRDQVTQALWALVQNAVEAARDAGIAPELRLAAAIGDRLILEVADNGPGVPAEQRTRIFQPFVTTKADGSGIGLPLARQIARAHGGELELRPPGDGPGACLHMTLELPAG